MGQAAVLQSSFWPFLISFNLLFLIFNTVSIFMMKNFSFNFFLFLFFTFIMILWFKDLFIESMMGFHNHKLELGLRMGMLLFILSEIFFFISFFWGFFDAAMSPAVEYGLLWPPKGIISISFYSVPLLNTVILLSSGVTITWAHHALISNDFNNSLISQSLTILLGIYFLIMQFEEYYSSSFSMSDGVYGSIFFMATGFHGLHVTMGTLGLIYILKNMMKANLIFNHHFSFEAVAWYWHFVDVVWLFLYLVIYVWFS